MFAVEGTTDEHDKYFTEEEEILWPANLYPGWVSVVRYK